MRGFAKLLLVLLPFFAEAQTVISFSYDSSGNRIKREIVLESRSIGDEHIKEFTETISAKQIKIYPNPTRGLLKVEIAGWEDSDKCRFLLHSVSGKLVSEGVFNDAVTEIEMTDCINGVYLLSVEINGENTVWKIIKK